MKAKRWISLLLAVSMMLGVLAMPASAAAQQPESTAVVSEALPDAAELTAACLLYTSPSPRDRG